MKDLTGLDKGERLLRLHALGDETAAHFREVLLEALPRFQQRIVLIHVPPSREACWHLGRISDDKWLPHFSFKAIVEAMAAPAGL